MRVSRFFIIIVIVILSPSAQASLNISAFTNKSVYELGETVNLSITVFNSGSTAETLMGGGKYLMEDGSGGIISTDYIIDDTYIWSDRYGVTDGTGIMWMREFQPGQTDSWVMSHGTLQMQDYPLDVGMHSVVGKAGFDLYSNPISFQVIPEPTTISLLALGAFWAGKRRRR
jgi:hypothetical protein